MVSLLVWTACAPQQQRPERTISVSIEPLRYFVEALADQRFHVAVMVPKGASPESYDPTPRQLVDLGRSEAYLQVGHLGFERAWMERLQAGAPAMRVYDLSDGIDLIHEEEGEEHAGHVHEGGVEPHIWTSTVNAAVMAEHVCEALCRLDSANAPFYCHRLDSLQQVIRQTDQAVRNLLADADRAFLIYHPSLSYFARDYGLEQIPIEKAGKEPSPAYLKELIDRCRTKQVRVVFVQPEFDRRHAELIAEQTQTQVCPIHPLAYDWADEMLAVARALHHAKP